MDPVPPPFRPSQADVVRLVEASPLAWVVTLPLSGLLLPVRPVLSPSGELTGLRGHFPRSSPMVQRLRADAGALILFSGPEGYISPSWMRNRAQAPTWSSVSVAFHCRIHFEESGAALDDALRDLIDAMERQRSGGWSMSELGDRHGTLARRIVAFRGDIVGQRAVFRLCQDEDPDTFSDVVAALRSEGREALADMMEVARGTTGAAAVTPRIEDCVNSTCPWSGQPVSTDALMIYGGKVVGFCNPSCRDKFAVAVTAFETPAAPARIDSPREEAGAGPAQRL